MREFIDSATLSEEEVHHLQKLLGSPLHSLMLHRTNLELKGAHHILSPSFSLRSKSGGFVTIANTWRETFGGWDYGRLSVTPTNHPPGTDQAQGGGLCKPNVLRMKPFESVPPVEKIDIFERVLQASDISGVAGEGEYIRYDAAIVFRRTDNSSFRLSPEEGPVGRVEFCQIWRDIYDISVSLKRRVMITAKGTDFDPPPA